MSKKEIELLAPAKNLEQGLEAIRCGADAVYIGASMFGARQSATNTLSDIKELVDEAHRFGVKVFVTLNTILFDDELKNAKKQAEELIGVGVDALIVQDMAYATFGLDIPLHASTQMATFNLEKAKSLNSLGFSRIVVERALNIDEISSICKGVDADIEAFVHGAICVSQSGQCYLGHALSGRSGNRGVCSQPCRSRYDLVDNAGNVVLKDKHLLSVRDMDFSNSLEELINAGVTSLKIEGRLKDKDYLKNTVIHYNKLLNDIVDNSSNLKRSSLGRSKVDFKTVLSKCFSRGAGDYFLHGVKPNIASYATGKAMGELIGSVENVKNDSFTILNAKEKLNNGDGICFSSEGVFRGTNINNSDGVSIEPNKLDGIKRGVKIYRNYDHKYITSLLNLKVNRTIEAEMAISFNDDYILLVASSLGFIVSRETSTFYEKANNLEATVVSIQKQLSKSGGTMFSVDSVLIDGDPLFIPAKVLNGWRREMLEELAIKISSSYVRSEKDVILPTDLNIPSLNYKANIVNRASRDFYRKCGVTKIDDGVELKSSLLGVELMRCRYCILREIGRCRLGNNPLKQELFLSNNGEKLKLVFDCKNCEMIIMK
ncbi:MAG: U32 family peptidase [Bacteroidetes bacterium]|nr:U32 family peptidase [Bacteroidota bacterium]